MKKLLLTFAAALMAVGLSAQSVMPRDITAGKVLVERSSVNSGMKKNVAKKVTLADNQRIMGAYKTDQLAESGLGAPGKTGIMKAVTKLPNSMLAKFSGGKIVMLRIGLWYAAENFKLYIASIDANGKETVLVSQDAGTGKKGWNEVAINNPCTIDASNVEALYLGFEYKQKSTNSGGKYKDECYPLSLVETPVMTDFLLYGNLGEGAKWYNFGTEYGTLSIQAVVELDNIPNDYITLNSLTIDKKYAKVGEKLGYKVALDNFGKNKANNYVLDLAIDGTKVGSFNSTAPLEVNADYDANGEITIPATLANGTHKLSVSLASINGQAVSYPDNKCEASFISYENSVPRQKLLLEQFTSQYCTWCPLGGKFLKALCDLRKDMAWVAIHGNMQQKDKFNNRQCDSIMAYIKPSGFPTASYNRLFISELLDAQDAADNIAYVCAYKEQYINQAAEQISGLLNRYTSSPVLAPININSNYDETSRKLDITISGQGVNGAGEALADYGIYVYLTEDGLKAYQTNGGSNFIHNNTFRVALGTVKGNTISWNGDAYENNFSYTVPAEYVTKNMHVVAFIAPKVNITNPDHFNMEVHNCEIVSLETQTGIEDIATEDKNVEIVARYNAAGQEINVPETGVNILKLSNGKTVKVVVK